MSKFNNPYAAFWAAHAAGKIRDVPITTCMDPAARFNMGHRAHLGQMMARNYKDKAVKLSVEKVVDASVAQVVENSSIA